MTRAVEPDATEIEIYPLERGMMLAGLEWWPFYGHRFEQSDLYVRAVASGRLDWIGGALLLWNACMRQDPCGTAENDPLYLAHMVRMSVASWSEIAPEILRGWRVVQVATPDGGDVERITHPVIRDVAKEQFRRTQAFKAGRASQGERKRRSRLIAKMTEMHVPPGIVGSGQTVGQILDYLTRADLYLTDQNIRAALSECVGWSGNVASIKGSKMRR